jgi:hypothetical protein
MGCLKWEFVVSAGKKIAAPARHLQVTVSMTRNGKTRCATEREGRQSPGQMVGRLPASAARRLPRALKSGTALRMDACSVQASCLESAGSQTFVTGRFVSAAGQFVVILRRRGWLIAAGAGV